MTLHNAKGLEFPLVFIAGMEEGLFPLARARDEVDTLEEERRLFYVGITRAEDKLYLCWARQRRRAGDFSYNSLSTFVESVPDELLERRTTERLRLLADSTPHRRRPRAHESWGSGAGYGSRSGFEPEYEPDADQGLNQDLPRFVKGERVIHETFGSGSVVEISGFGRDLKVTVDFDVAGRKKLLLRYASLEKDWP
jgi:DNA helicase-2/ATP-dependent DNA helicase PcrA